MRVSRPTIHPKPPNPTIHDVPVGVPFLAHRNGLGECVYLKVRNAGIAKTYVIILDTSNVEVVDFGESMWEILKIYTDHELILRGT